MKRIIDLLIKWLSFVIGWQKEDIEIEINEPEVPVSAESEASGETEYNEETEKPMEKKEYRIKVLLDNGHASTTPGKRSPKEEGIAQFFEYEFNRDIVRRIAEKFDAIGIKYEILVPEVDVDVPLKTRAARANKFCDEYGTENCLFISVHSNAAGKGDKWMTAKGWCCYTSKGETASDPYAEIFMKEAEKVLLPLGKTVRKYSQKKYSWEDNFTVLTKTKCSAILTENLFYDNKEEVAFLQTEEGRNAIAQIHVNAVIEIEKNLGS